MEKEKCIEVLYEYGYADTILAARCGVSVTFVREVLGKERVDYKGVRK